MPNKQLFEITRKEFVLLMKKKGNRKIILYPLNKNGIVLLSLLRF